MLKFTTISALLAVPCLATWGPTDLACLPQRENLGCGWQRVNNRWRYVCRYGPWMIRLACQNRGDLDDCNAGRFCREGEDTCSDTAWIGPDTLVDGDNNPYLWNTESFDSYGDAMGACEELRDFKNCECGVDTSSAPTEGNRGKSSKGGKGGKSAKCADPRVTSGSKSGKSDSDGGDRKARRSTGGAWTTASLPASSPPVVGVVASVLVVAAALVVVTRRLRSSAAPTVDATVEHTFFEAEAPAANGSA